MIIETFICAHPVISAILAVPILFTVIFFMICAADDDIEPFVDFHFDIFKFFYNLITGEKKKEHLKEVYKKWLKYEPIKTDKEPQEFEAGMIALGAEPQNVGRDYVYHNRNER